eukprot:1395845-Rhodomonas_salina.2
MIVASRDARHSLWDVRHSLWDERPRYPHLCPTLRRVRCPRSQVLRETTAKPRAILVQIGQRFESFCRVERGTSLAAYALLCEARYCDSVWCALCVRQRQRMALSGPEIADTRKDDSRTVCTGRVSDCN